MVHCCFLAMVNACSLWCHFCQQYVQVSNLWLYLLWLWDISTNVQFCFYCLMFFFIFTGNKKNIIFTLCLHFYKSSSVKTLTEVTVVNCRSMQNNDLITSVVYRLPNDCHFLCLFTKKGLEKCKNMRCYVQENVNYLNGHMELKWVMDACNQKLQLVQYSSVFHWP